MLIGPQFDDQKKALMKIRKRFEVLVGDRSFELATPAV
jgi:hypothetical protein